MPSFTLNPAWFPSRSLLRSWVRNRWVLVTAALLSLGVLGSLTATSPTLKHSLVLATTRQPEPFTELYFIHYAPHSTPLPVGRATTFEYAIANHEGRDLAYPCRVTIIHDGLPTTTEDTLTVPAGARAVRTVALQPVATGQVFEVIIELPQQQQTIHIRATS